jgi:hypothetical protein
MHMSSQTAEGRARETIRAMYDANRYWPKWEVPPVVESRRSRLTFLPDDPSEAT